MWMAGNLHGPVGMSFIEVTVFTDHLRLHPDAEIHAKFLYFFTERGNPSGQFFRVGFPVTQRRSIVVTSEKPPIIHDKEFNSGIFSGLCQLQKLLFIYFKIAGFPTV